MLIQWKLTIQQWQVSIIINPHVNLIIILFMLGIGPSTTAMEIEVDKTMESLRTLGLSKEECDEMELDPEANGKYNIADCIVGN